MNNFGVMHRRGWKDVAYESIALHKKETRTFWHQSRLHDEAKKKGAPLDPVEAWAAAVKLVAEEDRLGARLNFEGAC